MNNIQNCGINFKGGVMFHNGRVGSSAPHYPFQRCAINCNKLLRIEEYGDKNIRVAISSGEDKPYILSSWDFPEVKDLYAKVVEAFGLAEEKTGFINFEEFIKGIIK